MGPMAGHDTSLRVPASCRPGEHHKTRREVTEIVEEYVEGIFRLREALGKVTTGDLAEYMCVSAGSASAMLRRLKDLRLVKHEPYRSIELTEEGERLAKQLTRTHRILKRFLVDVVGLPWNDVHEIACKLEHHVSGDVVDQIFDRLGRPATCPHGNPIDPDTEDGSIPLYRAAEGQVWVVQRLRTRDMISFDSWRRPVWFLGGRSRSRGERSSTTWSISGLGTVNSRLGGTYRGTFGYEGPDRNQPKRGVGEL